MINILNWINLGQVNRSH